MGLFPLSLPSLVKSITTISKNIDITCANPLPCIFPIPRSTSCITLP